MNIFLSFSTGCTNHCVFVYYAAQAMGTLVDAGGKGVRAFRRRVKKRIQDMIP